MSKFFKVGSWVLVFEIQGGLRSSFLRFGGS